MGADAERRHVWRREMAMALGMLPFALVSTPFVPGAWIGWVVLANGVATHVACAFGWRYCDYLRVADTAVNVTLCVLVNVLTHWQPKSLLFTAFVALAWAINSPPPLTELGNQTRTTILKNWLVTTLTLTPDARKARRKQARSIGVHILLIQWMLCFLLAVHELQLFDYHA